MVKSKRSQRAVVSLEISGIRDSGGSAGEKRRVEIQIKSNPNQGKEGINSAIAGQKVKVQSLSF